MVEMLHSSLPDSRVAGQLRGEHPPFRKRLLLSLGVILAMGLLMIGGLALLGAWALLNYNARAQINSEVKNIAAHVVQDDRLFLDAHPWDEPHHRFTDPRIDPHFVQVFDGEGRPLLSSFNIARLSERFPARLLAVTDRDLGVEALRTFEVDGTRYYYLTTPLTTQDGAVLGYLQIARYEPGIGLLIRNVGLGIASGYVLVLVGFIALLWAVGGQVVRPLEAMTRSARTLSPERLNQRVPIPPDADRETAELGRALNDALGRLEGAFDEMRRFTADAAHELQTPLTVLLGHIDVALRRERTPAAYRETLHVLRDESEELIRTVRGLLTLARLEGPARSPEPVELDRLAREEAEAALPRAEAKGLVLTTEWTPGIRVRGYPALLREAIRNLIDNAVKYTSSGRIEVKVYCNGDQATFSVEDTGIGIAPEHLPLVTGRFWRAVNMQHVPGSGLGLSLVDRVAVHHNGRLRLDSEPGVGTRARIEVPLEAVPTGTPPVREAAIRTR